MKVSRICVALLVACGMVTTATSARAEINTNFVKDFLSRYRPSRTALSATPTTPSSQDGASLVRNGQLPLTVGHLNSRILQYNLKIDDNLLRPHSSMKLIKNSQKHVETTMRKP